MYYSIVTGLPTRVVTGIRIQSQLLFFFEKLYPKSRYIKNIVSKLSFKYYEGF